MQVRNTNLPKIKNITPRPTGISLRTKANICQTYFTFYMGALHDVNHSQNS